MQIIDRAVPPEKKSGPNRIFITLVGGFSGLFFSVFLIFFSEWAGADEKQKLNIIKEHLLPRFLREKILD